MLQYLRNIESTYRIVPNLKQSLCTLGSALAVTEDISEKRNQDVVRRRNRKTYKHNFIQNLFLGIFEPEVLEYPQIRTKQEVDYMKQHKEKTDNLMLHKIDPKSIEATGNISKDVLLLLQEHDVLGMKLKVEKDGLGYFESESSYIQESLSSYSSIGKTIAETESCGYQTLNLFGSEVQKSIYLPQFLNGDCVACLAHLEHNFWASQDVILETTAVELGDDTYSISGSKTLVYNPGNVDVMFISARTSDDGCGYTIFMVDKCSQGLKVLNPLDNIGLKGVEICDIVLENVIVSKDKIVGKINEGNIVIRKLAEGKMCNGAQCIGLMKNIVNSIISHCINKQQFKRHLYKQNYVQGNIGQLVDTLYAAESMTYLLTGRVDENDDIDVMLESIIIKIFNSEALNVMIHALMQLTGKDKSCEELTERLIRDCYFFSAFDDPNGYLKVHLSSSGIKYLLAQMKNRTEKEYKPRSRLNLINGKRGRHVDIQEVLFGYLHPALKEESKALEYCVKFLNFLSETLIQTYGNNVLNQIDELNRLAEIVIMIYRLAAVLARASRSYCIGLHNAEVEILIARNVARNSYRRVITIFDLITCAKHRTNYGEIGKLVLENKTSPWPHAAKPIMRKGSKI